jgi:DNA repair protein SbcC/Rad50
MKPIDLILKGFKGIASGRGKPEIHLDLRLIPGEAALVALVGDNGAGKTTIMDNLHPYRLMPSRSTSLSPGGFSYWDNVGPDASKELIWEHDGKTYQSILTFRQTGKTQKQECYLLEDISGVFEPVILADGTQSDGKTTSYDKCIESILGSSEVYFVAAFAAQKRKTLSEMGATEIKLILSSVLGHEKYRELGAKAADVVKLLKVSLAEVQVQIQDMFTFKAKYEALQVEKLSLTAQRDLESAKLKELQQTRDMVQRHLYELEAQLKTGANFDAQRTDLVGQLAKIDQEHVLALNAARDAYSRESGGQIQNRDNLQLQIASLAKESSSLNAQFAAASLIVQSKESIEVASKKVAELGPELVAIDAKITAAQVALTDLKGLRDRQSALTSETSSLATNGKSASEKLEQIKVVASLIDVVPCSGNPMQDQCKLLSQAKAAKDEVATLTAKLNDYRNKYRDDFGSLTKVKESIVALEVIEAEVKGLQSKRVSVADSIAQQQAIAAKASLLKVSEETIESAGKRLNEIKAEELALAQKLLVATQEIEAGKALFEKRNADLSAEFSNRKLAYQDQLNSLPKPLDASAFNDSKQQLASLNGQITSLTTVSNGNMGKLSEVDRQIAVLQEKLSLTKRLEDSADQFGLEIANWSLISKVFGNDGLIALSIDDCGPEISSLTNQILSDCFGGRFSVRIDTQTETKQGSLKETFEVMVNDCLRGEEKPASLVSGGESVWINESLTRAIALYQAQKSGQSYQTLFSDEADGPLSPEKKRQFIQMKRAVLDIGGYEREFFISQTPELWEMADHIIDVGKL